MKNSNKYQLEYIDGETGEKIKTEVLSLGYIKAKGVYANAREKLKEKMDNGEVGHTVIRLIQNGKVVEGYDSQLEDAFDEQIEASKQPNKKPLEHLRDNPNVSKKSKQTKKVKMNGKEYEVKNGEIEDSFLPEDNEPKQEESQEQKKVLPNNGYLSTMKHRLKEIENLIMTFNDLQKKIMGEDVLESINFVLDINKELMGYEPIYKKDDNGEVQLDYWGKPEVEVYAHERIELKRMIDMQMFLAGHYGFLSERLAKFKGNSGLKKARIDMASNYLYVPAKDYIIEELKQKRTDKYIQSVIDQQLLPEYANQRMSAIIATVLETVCKSAELSRNVLNATIQYRKDDMVNSLHLDKSQV